MTLETFIAENLWGLLVGAVSLIVSVVAIVVTVKLSIKQIDQKIGDMQTKMDAKDDDHDRAINTLRENVASNRERIGIVESRLDQTIRHIGEQLNRIHDKLFGS